MHNLANLNLRPAELIQQICIKVLQRALSNVIEGVLLQEWTVCLYISSSQNCMPSYVARAVPPTEIT